MKNIMIAVIVLLLVCSGAYAQETARGYVFYDRDMNGQKDPEEIGLRDVCVSNGRDVVLTDDNGMYELPVDNDDIIFVIQPKGYKVDIRHTHMDLC